MFTQNKEDRKRVEKALEIAGLPSGKVSSFSHLYRYIFKPRYHINNNSCGIEVLF